MSEEQRAYELRTKGRSPIMLKIVSVTGLFIVSLITTSLQVRANRALKKLLPKLQTKSHQRVSTNSDYQKYVKSLKRGEDLTKRERVSLNLSKRLAEAEAQQALNEELEILGLKASALSGGDEDELSADLVMEEALSILSDLAENYPDMPEFKE